eukprot:TRINITY_DN33294_c0_g1_i1.p1 TRINITY_DN33294_c0_g1~~TRINITY_DN33294_c0_g1_i1.p1  ORF type:complete len:225 (+),score=79.13 TRINITY_DN33294_c0_g1_i1:1017-1691(+)
MPASGKGWTVEPLTAAKRSDVADFFATQQLFLGKVLKDVPVNELREYGGVLYDACALDPCTSTVLFDNNQTLVGVAMCCRPDYYQAVDEGQLSKPCAQHLALFKSFQRPAEEYVAEHDSNSMGPVTGVYFCVLPKYQGNGALMAMITQCYNLCLTNGCGWVWTWSANKMLVGKRTPLLRHATFHVSPYLKVTDVQEFEYEGERPYKASIPVYIALFKIAGASKL